MKRSWSTVQTSDLLLNDQQKIWGERSSEVSDGAAAPPPSLLPLTPSVRTATLGCFHCPSTCGFLAAVHSGLLRMMSHVRVRLQEMIRPIQNPIYDLTDIRVAIQMYKWIYILKMKGPSCITVKCPSWCLEFAHQSWKLSKLQKFIYLHIWT